jgi:tetratricopeptide (TPR) repeat protein
LFLHDVKISYNSAKGNCSAGGILYEKAKSETDTLRRRIELNSSINYLNTSLRIYPNYVQATLLLGNAYYLRDKDYNKTLSCYNKIFAMSPDDDLAFNNLKIVLSSANDIYFKMKGYHSILKYRFSDFTANYQLGVIYGRYLNKLDTSVIYLTRATIIKPDSKEANRDLGVALAMIGKKQMALTYFEKTLQLDPKEPANYVNVGITYQELGDNVKANEFFRKADELKKKH